MLANIEVRYLSIKQIQVIDKFVGAVIAHREGEINLVIKNGRLRFIRPARSIEFEQSTEIESGPLIV